jgi:hypothetical protein
MKKMNLFFAVMVMALVLVAGNSYAAFTLPTSLTTMELGPVEAWLGLAVVAYAAMFGYRKFIKSANRS